MLHLNTNPVFLIQISYRIAIMKTKKILHTWIMNTNGLRKTWQKILNRLISESGK